VEASGKTKQAETAKAGPSSSQIIAEEQAAMEAMMEMDEDFDDEDDLGGATSAPAPVVKTDAVERKRKRRTVKKSKMEMDDKGYMGKQFSIYFLFPCPSHTNHGRLYVHGYTDYHLRMLHPGSHFQQVRRYSRVDE
jgi:hypothetical protein